VFETAELFNDHAQTLCSGFMPVQTLCPLDAKKEWECGVCHHGGNSLDAMLSHMQEEHDFSKLLQCVQCQIFFPDRESHLQHQSAHAAVQSVDQSSFNAEVAGDAPGEKEITITVDSSAPLSRFHNDAEQTSEEAILIKCPLCDNLFPSLREYRSHQESVHQRHVCHVCSHSFSAKRKLARHFSAHLKKMIFSCPQCSLRFHSQTLLQKHVDGKFCHRVA
jgi:uncharacterized C2H2 Zn-finger protein